MKSYRTNLSHCKGCGHELDAHSGTTRDERRPKKDDVGVCIYCGKISMFDDDLNLLPVTSQFLQLVKLESPATYKILIEAQKIIMERLNKN